MAELGGQGVWGRSIWAAHGILGWTVDVLAVADVVRVVLDAHLDGCVGGFGFEVAVVEGELCRCCSKASCSFLV